MFNKILYLIVFLLVFLLTVFFTKLYFLEDYYNVEKKHNEMKITNLITLINKKLYSIYNIANDYAKWDDTYIFLNGKNKYYIDNNFREGTNTLEDLELSFMIFQKLNGKKSFYSIFEDKSLNKNTFEKFIFNKLSKNENIKTILKFQKQVFLITKTSISNSSSNFEKNGYLYVGKLIDNKFLKDIALNFKTIEFDFNTIVKEGRIHGNNHIKYIFNDEINASEILSKVTIFNDKRENSFSLIAKTDLDFTSQGKKTIIIFSLIISFFITTIFIILFRQNKHLSVKVNEKTKALEENLKELKKLTDMFNDSQKITHIGTYDYNLKTREVIWSDEHFRILGKTPGSFKPYVDDYFKYIHPEDKTYVDSMLEDTIKYDNVNIFRYRLILDDSSMKYVQSTAGISKKDKYGDILDISGTIFDITALVKQEKELKSKEALLIEQSKMAVMGEMIGNISHQFKQPLNLISTIASSIKVNKELGFLNEETIISSMESITQATKHLSSTVDDFRDFFSPNKMEKKILIKDLFKRAYGLVNAQFNIDSIKVIENIENIEITTYDNELLQVILNIFNNAKDELKKLEYKKRLLFIDVKKEKDFLYIKIKDNAGGIKKEILKKVFDAYFTTKKDNKGTGIGLYMSKQIICKNLDGQLYVENSNFKYNEEDYQGALFTIELKV